MDEQQTTGQIMDTTNTDGAFESDFENGVMEGLENQQPQDDDTGEGAAEGLENQQPDHPSDKPETPPAPQDGQDPPAAQQAETPPAPQLVSMTYNGRQIMLPQDAVSAIGQALGGDPIALLQKGMNYDSKAARELRVLDRYAEASGLTRAQYLEQLEGMQRQQELASEVEKCRAEFPDTPDAALTAIAEGRCAAKRAAEQQQIAEREQYLAGVRQRAAQQLADNKRAAAMREWDAYEQLADVHKPEDVPPRVLELVQQGMTPTAAHWRHQAEQAQQQAAQQTQINKQTQKNAASSAGSMSGTGDETGFEADFARAFAY